MKNKLILLILIILSSCNGNSQSNKNKLIEINSVKINLEIVNGIKNLSKKEWIDNSVIRYKPSDKYQGALESYDSIVNGFRFKFVNEIAAYKIVEKYFDRVKESGNYLYLTKLDFDDSYNSFYDIVIAHIPNQLELLKFVRTESPNYDLYNKDIIDWFKKKEAEFEFQIFVADLSRVEAKIIGKPNSYQKLGKEIFEFCPDVIYQGHSDMDELVDYLKSSKHMWFWWD